MEGPMPQLGEMKASPGGLDLGVKDRYVGVDYERSMLDSSHDFYKVVGKFGVA